MRVQIVAVTLFLSISPALAGWQFADISDDSGTAFKSWVHDTAGTIEMEVYCDDWLPGLIDLTIYTTEAAGTDDMEAAEGTMVVVADGEQRMDVTAFLDDFDKELILYTSNFDIDNLLDLMLLMAKANQTIDVTYSGRSYRFSAEGAHDAISRMADMCPEE